MKNIRHNTTYDSFFYIIPYCRVPSGRGVVGGSLTPHCVPCVRLLRFNLFWVVERLVIYQTRANSFPCLLPFPSLVLKVSVLNCQSPIFDLPGASESLSLTSSQFFSSCSSTLEMRTIEQNSRSLMQPMP